MLAAINKWKKIEVLPPYVDEIGYIGVQKLDKGIQIVNETETIVIFLDFKRQGVEELKEEVIEMSQVIGEFMKTVFQKYLAQNLPQHIQMIYQGIILQQEKSFNHYDIKSQSKVIFILTDPNQSIPNSFYINVKTLTNKIFKLLVRPYDSIDSLKAQIEVQEGIPPEGQRLIFQAQQLEGRYLLSEYLIRKESIVNLVLRLRGGGNEKFVKLQKIGVEIYGKEETFDIKLNILVQNLKVKIEKQKGILVSKQKLYYKGILMNDNFAIEDYFSNQDICTNLHLKVEESEEKKQAIQQSQITESYISVISNNQQYQLAINKNQNYDQLKDILETLESREYIENSLILCNGKPISLQNLNNDNTPLINVQSIFLIDQQSGGIPIKFTLEINDYQLENVSQLKDSLQWLRNSQINEFIQVNLDEINGNQKKKQNYQQIPLPCLIAVRLYTSNLIYRKLNNDLRTSDYSSWKKYLRYLLEGLRHMKYHNGVAYRGIMNYQNTTIYKKGKVVQWSEVTSISLDYKIAQSFSNNKGMIFNVQTISAKDIANISIYEGEQELIMYPFSTFVVDGVEAKKNQPLIVTLRELPLPRSNYVVLWVDDNPEYNYIYAQEVERKNTNISVIFCTSTKDAILIIQKYQWMIYLDESQFRVVSDMVRIEDGQTNYNAGIELLSHLYQKIKYKNKTLIFCGDPKRAQQECKSRNIQGNFENTNNIHVLKKFLQFK